MSRARTHRRRGAAKLTPFFGCEYNPVYSRITDYTESHHRCRNERTNPAGDVVPEYMASDSA